MKADFFGKITTPFLRKKPRGPLLTTAQLSLELFVLGLLFLVLGKDKNIFPQMVLW